jgi:hypothetical protein
MHHLRMRIRECESEIGSEGANEDPKKRKSVIGSEGANEDPKKRKSVIGSEGAKEEMRNWLQKEENRKKKGKLSNPQFSPF